MVAKVSCVWGSVMSITLDKFNAACNALKAGEELRNKETWKSVQTALAPTLVILGAVAQFIDLPLTGGQLQALAFLIAGIGALLNSYLTVATTESLGIKK